MRELFTTVFVFAAAFMLWRTLRPQRHSRYQTVPNSLLPTPDTRDESLYTWPPLNLFNCPVADTDRYQAALARIAQTNPAHATGTRVVAELHTSADNPDMWKPVEVRAPGLRVGFLSNTNASRFRRRLAYEGFAGQTTRCDALLTLVDNRYTIQLDLKEFRH
jgi:hypothetical protein